MSGSIGRRNTGVKISLLGFQIARSHVVVRLADEPLCSDRLANAPTSRCIREVLSQQAIGVLVRPALPRALRIAKIYLNVSRQRKTAMIRKFLSPVPGQRLIQLPW